MLVVGGRRHHHRVAGRRDDSTYYSPPLALRVSRRGGALCHGVAQTRRNNGLPALFVLYNTASVLKVCAVFYAQILLGLMPSFLHTHGSWLTRAASSLEF